MLAGAENEPTGDARADSDHAARARDGRIGGIGDRQCLRASADKGRGTREDVHAGVAGHHAIILGQRGGKAGIGSGEVDSACVARRNVVELIQRLNRKAEGFARGGADWSNDHEMRGGAAHHRRGIGTFDGAAANAAGRHRLSTKLNRLTPKMPTPLVNVASAGSFPAVSLLVKCTAPV